MKYILMDYVNESGWPRLTRSEQQHWLGAYRAYMEAMTEVADLDAAISWAARSPTALHGVVEVRPVMEGTLLTRDINELIKPE